MSTLHRLFDAWIQLVHRHHPEYRLGKFIIAGVEERTWRNWFSESEPTSPGPGSAERVAEKMWDICTTPVSRSLMFQAVQDQFPNAPIGSWKDQPKGDLPAKHDFAKWIAAQAHENALELRLDVLVGGSKGSELVDFRSITTEPVLPVAEGQRLRIKVTASDKSYLYLAAITPSGRADKLFPWDPQTSKMPKTAILTADTWLLPEGASWSFETEAGFETVVALGVYEPLDASALASLEDNFFRRDFTEADAANPGPFACDLLKSVSQASTVRLNTREKLLKDSLGRRHAEIATALGDYSDALVCLSFRNRGKTM